MLLTREGRHLADADGRLLLDLEAVESELHRQSEHVVGRLGLAAFSTAMRGLVAPAMPSLLQAHPGVEIALVPRLGRAPLGPELIALEVRDPVPTRDIVVLHRRTMTGSPAVVAMLDTLTAAGADLVTS